METAFTRLVGCSLPLQQAGMGGAATPGLAAAVSNAGAFGTVGLAGMPSGVVERVMDEVAALTTQPFGANFLVPFLAPDAVAVAARRARVVEFFYGEPDRALVDAVHELGALAAWQIGSVSEAREAQSCGCDLVIAQGVEAGGHVRGTTALADLLREVLDELAVPVVAAGGLGSARAVSNALEAGAAGVRIGTRFLAAVEADVHHEYLDALVAAGPDDTVLTTTFCHLWPDAPHRVLRGCIEAANLIEDALVGETDIGPGLRIPVPRFSPFGPGRAASGHVEAMAHYAGRSVGDVRGPTTAAAVVAELMAGLDP